MPLASQGIELETFEAGAGRPIVLLHGFQTIDPRAPFLDRLAGHGRILAPSHPGFGHSPRPDDFDSVYDLVHLYLAVLDELPGGKVTLVGFSFGGWLAAEIAVKSAHRLDRLVLVDPVGIRISGPDTPDITDVFNRSPQEVHRASWHDPDRFKPDYDEMSEDALAVLHRNRESLCRYAWHPYMYNPHLRRWLRRIAVPTLVLWGGSDRIVTPAYGRAYAASIPGARLEVIDGAGHHPEIEQPEAFVERVVAFLKE